MGKIIFILLIALITVSSCSLEKRLYRPGFSIQWSGLKRYQDHKDRVELKIRDLSEVRDTADIETSFAQTAELDDELLQASIQDELILTKEDQLNPLEEAVSVNYIRTDRDQKSPEIAVLERSDTKIDVKSTKKTANVLMIIALIVLSALFVGSALYFGALFPQIVGTVLIFPFSFLFAMDDRAGFLFGLFWGISYLFLFFFAASAAFWPMVLLGLATFLLSLFLGVQIDEFLDGKKRQDDLPPPQIPNSEEF
jgi:hypothetical protein